MTQGTVRDEAVAALAREVVSDVSPAELPLFAATVTRYRSDPAETLRSGGASDRALGFGVETAVVLVTPFALELVKRMFARLADRLGDSAADSLAGRIRGWFSDREDQPEESDEPAALSADQLRMVAEVTRTEAASLQMPAEESERLADAVIATLATHA
ncbi:MAG: hypothetical protein OEU98_08910 [Actinomycetota bacterium]|nr:hypothetical protein [Actinomycetota bacterium]